VLFSLLGVRAAAARLCADVVPRVPGQALMCATSSLFVSNLRNTRPHRGHAEVSSCFIGLSLCRATKASNTGRLPPKMRRHTRSCTASRLALNVRPHSPHGTCCPSTPSTDVSPAAAFFSGAAATGGCAGEMWRSAAYALLPAAAAEAAAAAEDDDRSGVSRDSP